MLKRVGNISEEYGSTGLFWGTLYFTHVRGKQPQYGWGVMNVQQTLDDEVKVINNIHLRQSHRELDSSCFKNSIRQHLRIFVDITYRGLNMTSSRMNALSMSESFRSDPKSVISAPDEIGSLRLFAERVYELPSVQRSQQNHV